MTVRDLITALLDQDMDAEVITNVWTSEDGILGQVDTICGEVELVVKVSAGVAIKGSEST